MSGFFEEHRKKEPERVARLREAVVSFVGGGGLPEFAGDYVGPFNPVGGWDYTLLKDMAQHLAYETEVVEQFRRSCQAPDSDQEAVTRINELAELIGFHVQKGPLDGNKSGPGYAPLVLAACWHAQEPQSWQPYSGTAFRALRKCAPTVCGRHTHGKTHGERCLGFEQSVKTLAAAIELEVRRQRATTCLRTCSLACSATASPGSDGAVSTGATWNTKRTLDGRGGRSTWR